jgi:hypothetical protein
LIAPVRDEEKYQRVNLQVESPKRYILRLKSSLNFGSRKRTRTHPALQLQKAMFQLLSVTIAQKVLLKDIGCQGMSEKSMRKFGLTNVDFVQRNFSRYFIICFFIN